MAQEALARPGVGEQERRELLGEDVARADRIPDVAGHLVPAGRRRRNVAEIAVGEVLDLVVVVEDDAAVTGDAEVLEQEVAGEDVDRGELADRIAVVAHRVFALRVVGALEKQVERRSSAARCRGAG